jgi:hypothetical protein
MFASLRGVTSQKAQILINTDVNLKSLNLEIQKLLSMEVKLSTQIS